MSTGRPVRDHFVATLMPRLIDLGFKKRAGSILTMDLGTDVIGWLSIQTAIRRDGMVAVDPTIGLRHQEIERTLAALVGKAPHAYIPPTVSFLLGYLQGQGRADPWLFDDEAGADAAVPGVVERVVRFGVPYLQGRCTLAGLVSEFKPGRTPGLGHLALRLPIALRLLGDEDGAQDYVLTQLAELGDRTDPAASYYREFADAFTRTGRPGGTI